MAMRSAPPVPSPAVAASATPVVQLHGVEASHDGHVALHALDLSLPPGRHTVLVGPNGSGKSTLLAVLAGTHEAVRGPVERASGLRVGLVVQRSAVTDRLPLTVRETVAMGRWGAGRRRARADDRAAVDEALDALDITDLAGRSLSALSGGQRQRALVAQGLARRADLLLLDEPTAGVDAAAQRLIRRAVDGELARGATVVEATHDAELRGPGVTVVHLVDGCRVA